MPEGLLEILSLLTIGYILLLVEIFVPGGVIGVIGGALVVFGCYKAFGLGAGWGFGSLAFSVLVTLVMVKGFLRSRAAHGLVLDGEEPKTWKAAEKGLSALLGREGLTISPLRPAGLAEIDGQRVDVVADGEFLAEGVIVRVAEVEGNRVVVEAVEIEDAEDQHETW